jgi:hypothetical protein
MTTFTLRPLAIGTLALLIFAGNALSQTASPVLNTLEVQKLVASSEPGDNAKLSAHFASPANGEMRSRPPARARAPARRDLPSCPP